jgi:hypothetical protein
MLIQNALHSYTIERGFITDNALITKSNVIKDVKLIVTAFVNEISESTSFAVSIYKAEDFTDFVELEDLTNEQILQMAENEINSNTSVNSAYQTIVRNLKVCLNHETKSSDEKVLV